MTEECYRKIFAGILNIPRARLSLNINGILCEFLEKYGSEDVLKNIKTLIDRGNIELTGSAKYHAFLPLLPDSEIERQIRLNEESMNKYFGSSWKRGGFFSPEMAYSKRVAQIAQKMGYKWMILDSRSFPAEEVYSKDRIYKLKGVDNFNVFFRDHDVSVTILLAQAITAATLLRHLGSRLETDGYLVTAMDGETFGHHRPGLENLLFELLQSPEIEPVAVSDLVEKFPDHIGIEPYDSTWAITKKDLNNHVAFSRWNSEDNIIHKKQWELTNLAIEVVHRDSVGEEVRGMLDRALHSDQYWWASASPWWNIEMIERGAHELKSVVMEAPKASSEEKQKADDLYDDILATAFDWQRNGLVDEIARHEDEESHAIMEIKERPYVTKQEYKNMIDTLVDQMRLAAKSEDYYRAGMIKDRVVELAGEMEKAKE